jgi:hypothetical protein
MSGEVFDVTARKTHQWSMVGLIVIGFLLGAAFGDVIAAIPVAVAGLIMLAGRFWWPADVVRQLVWRVLEPRGLLTRVDRAEDHQTRRIARVIGGVVWLAAAVLLATGFTVLGWIFAFVIGAMVVLDASVSFCALCFAFLQLDRIGLLPASLRHT